MGVVVYRHVASVITIGGVHRARLTLTCPNSRRDVILLRFAGREPDESSLTSCRRMCRLLNSLGRRTAYIYK